jgi:hypothetical protein
LVLFRDPHKPENLWWTYVYQERSYIYLLGKEKLEKLGYVIRLVTADGFLSLPSVFKGIPFQMCQFHMRQIVVRYITRNPKTEAGQVLLAITKTLPHTDEYTFTQRLRNFYIKYQSFLNEKTIHPDGSSSSTHEGVVNAYKSLVKFLPYLFTYLKDKNIPSTTNTCEGHFSHIKDVVRIHRGISKQLKQKVIDAILLESTIAPKDK